jgi:threonine dehydrogenase-like Zn-dependent dehydrogenase
VYTRDDYKLAIELWKKGSLEMRPLITQRISLDEAPQVISAMADGAKGDDIKTVISFD